MNGLTMPDDFPGDQFNRVSAKAMPLASSRNEAYVELSSAWNALAYRYRAMIQHGDAFTVSIIADGTSPPADRRYHQEQCLFDFFSSGFSALDSFFYAAFAVGTCVDPAAFPLVTDKDRRNVSCEKTVTAYKRRFPLGQPLTALQTLADSPEHAEWRSIRNILTHRAAPGRTLYVSFGSDDVTPVDRWKPFDIPLDRKLTADRRAHLSKLLGSPMTALAEFAEAHL
jgi:hypothetical protein